MKLGEHAVAIDVSCKRHYHIYRRYDLVDVEKNVNVFLDLSDNFSEQGLWLKDQNVFRLFQSVVQRTQYLSRKSHYFSFSWNLHQILFNSLSYLMQINTFIDLDKIPTMIVKHQLHFFTCLLFYRIKVLLYRINSLSINLSRDCSKWIIDLLDFKQKYVLVFFVFHGLKVLQYLFFKIVLNQTFQHFDLVVLELWIQFLKNWQLESVSFLQNFI